MAEVRWRVLASFDTQNLVFAINDCSAIIDGMASITIRRLPENTKRRLRIRAARNGRSMEQEAREIIEAGLAQADTAPKDLGREIHRRFAALGGVNLKIPPRGPIRDTGIR
jgi:plasmid stability protein